MEGGRFDGMMGRLIRHSRVAGAVAGMSGLAQVGVAAAQDTAAAGNGGTATANASGGAVSVGDVNSGFNSGNAVAVGDVNDGSVAIDGGDLSTSTALDVSADGRVAVADASGGDGNFAFVS